MSRKRWREKPENRERYLAAQRRANAKNLRYRRDLAYRRRYGITIDDYENMKALQENRCAICDSLEPGGRRNEFCVDYDHETGQVRGLLCAACNRLLDVLESRHWRNLAEIYLNKYNESENSNDA